MDGTIFTVAREVRMCIRRCGRVTWQPSGVCRGCQKAEARDG